ncbi:MAG: hypothetical protein JWO51_150 [Rhodospirillales bacterium]|nr:hypothetical protein [Rhodospirillales bacterium]
MSVIGVNIVGDRQASVRFDTFPEKARAALLAKIRELTPKLETAVIAVVPVDKGKLLSEVHAYVDDDKNKVSGKVKVIIPGGGAEAGKVMALEYGAHKSFTVKAHAMRLDHFWGLAVAPTAVMVAAFVRTPNIQQHDFLRGPLAAMRSEILEGFAQALTQAAGAP